MLEWIDDPRRLYKDLIDLLALLDDRNAKFPVVHAAKLASSRRFHSVSRRPQERLKMIMSLIRKIPILKIVKQFQYYLQA